MPDDTQADRRPERPDMGPEKEPLRELTLGRPRTPPDPPKPRSVTRSTSDDDGLETLAANCRAKAEAARWAAERQRRLRERDEQPDQDAPTDPAMWHWAERLTDAFYWASADGPSGSPDISPLDHVGGCFESLAVGLLLVQVIRRRRGGLDKALPLLAEAQSAVRWALRRLQAPDDPDQLAAYEAVREAAARHRVFLKRFLRADDLADPEGWPGLLDRIEALSGAEAQSRRHERLLDRLRSQVRSLGGGGDAESSWRLVIEAVEEIVGGGVPPSSREVRGLLLPHIDDLPEGADLPPGSRLVLREIDRYLATRPNAAAPAPSQAPTAEVREAARLLSGRSVVLIGGIRRPQAQEVLRAALGLEGLIWIGTREHQSVRGFEAAIARPEVAVVLLAIRWSSHAFGDVKAFCDRHGKPLVRLPGGYNPAQVAAQIVSQCSGQLGDRWSPPLA
jgi:hypothetical protein